MAKDITDVIEQIEGKLESLEARQEELDHDIEVKRARIRSIEKLIEGLRELDEDGIPAEEE